MYPNTQPLFPIHPPPTPAPVVHAPPARSSIGYPLWAVPAAIVGFFALIAGLITLFLLSFRHSDAADLAIARASEHPAVIEHVGTPIDRGFPTGTIIRTGGTGTAILYIPIEGPHGESELFIEAKKHGEETWSADVLMLVTQDGERIDLLDS